MPSQFLCHLQGFQSKEEFTSDMFCFTFIDKNADTLCPNLVAQPATTTVMALAEQADQLLTYHKVQQACKMASVALTLVMPPDELLIEQSWLLTAWLLIWTIYGPAKTSTTSSPGLCYYHNHTLVIRPTTDANHVQKMGQQALIIKV